jgi:hypothetical protein
MGKAANDVPQTCVLLALAPFMAAACSPRPTVIPPTPALSAPEWVGDGEDLIRESGDRGPLLLSAKRGIAELGPALFGVPQRRELRATPLGGPDGPSVIALEISGSENVRLRLHHLAADRSEVLPLDHLLDVSPDGEWMAASAPGTRGRSGA